MIQKPLKFKHKENYTTHIMTKLLKNSEKENILKVGRKKSYTEETKNESKLLVIKYANQRQQNEIFKMLKEKILIVNLEFHILQECSLKINAR